MCEGNGCPTFVINDSIRHRKVCFDLANKKEDMGDLLFATTNLFLQTTALRFVSPIF